MARSIIAGDFAKDWQFAEAKREFRKQSREMRSTRKSKKQWEDSCPMEAFTSEKT